MGITLKGKPSWDMGPLTWAQVKGKVVEQAMTVDPDTGKQSNPNGVVRTRRETWLGRYAVKGLLTGDQVKIATELLDAHMGRQARDPLSALRIDRSHERPEPEIARFDARRKFHAMWALVPNYARPVIEHVVISDLSLRSMAGSVNGRIYAAHLDRMQRGLDALAHAW